MHFQGLQREYRVVPGCTKTPRWPLSVYGRSMCPGSIRTQIRTQYNEPWLCTEVSNRELRLFLLLLLFFFLVKDISKLCNLHWSYRNHNPPAYSSTHTPIHPFIHSSIHKYTQSASHACIHPFFHLYIHLPTYPLIQPSCACTYPHTHQFIHPLIHSSIHKPIQQSTHSSIYINTNSSTHPTTYLPIKFPIHSCIYP